MCTTCPRRRPRACPAVRRQDRCHRVDRQVSQSPRPTRDLPAPAGTTCTLDLPVLVGTPLAALAHVARDTGRHPAQDNAAGRIGRRRRGYFLRYGCGKVSSSTSLVLALPPTAGWRVMDHEV